MIEPFNHCLELLNLAGVQFPKEDMSNLLTEYSALL